jgi:Domain of Unknown Function (DUF748)
MPMTPTPATDRATTAAWLRRHWRWLAGCAGVVLAAAAVWQVALWQLRSAVLQSLGPGAQLAALRVGLAGVEIDGLRITAAPATPGGGAAAWPAEHELRADHVRLVPDWRGLWSGVRHGQWRLQSLHVRGGYVSLLRGADGRIRLLPSLLAPPSHGGSPDGGAAPGPRLQLAQLALDGTVVELFDASVRRPAHRLRLEDLQVRAGPLFLPHALSEAPTQLQLQAVLKGPRHDGRMSLQGQVHLGTQDAQLNARLQGVDMLALQPYLLKAGEGRIRGGRLDLQLDPQVQQQRLRAPGVLTLTGLDLAPGAGLGGLLAGVSRQAVLAALERDGRITLRFNLDGRLDDPGFSINENLAQRVGGALAESVGVSLSGVVEGVGGLFKGLLGR